MATEIGVIVNETLSSRVPTFVPANKGTIAILINSQRGPINTPILVSNFETFTKIFGESPLPNDFSYYVIKGFFDNVLLDGSNPFQLYLVRPIADSDTSGNPPFARRGTSSNYVEFRLGYQQLDSPTGEFNDHNNCFEVRVTAGSLPDTYTIEVLRRTPSKLIVLETYTNVTDNDFESRLKSSEYIIARKVGSGSLRSFISYSVTKINIISPGSGYNPSTTTFSITPQLPSDPLNLNLSIDSFNLDLGSGATAIATINDGRVESIIVTNQGSNYLQPPQVIISGGGGTGATARANISNGRVVSITITNPGSGYTSSPTVTIQSGGFLKIVPSYNYGYNLNSQIVITAIDRSLYGVTQIEIAGGSGSGATAEAIFNPDGTIIAVTVTNGGSGYTSSPVVIVSGNSTREAILEAEIDESGQVVRINILDGGLGYNPDETSISIVNGSGLGYQSPPTIEFIGGNPITTAQAVASIDASGRVVSITITNPGSGYTSPPTVRFVGGNPSRPAVAYARIGQVVPNNSPQFEPIIEPTSFKLLGGTNPSTTNISNEFERYRCGLSLLDNLDIELISDASVYSQKMHQLGTDYANKKADALYINSVPVDVTKTQAADVLTGFTAPLLGVQRRGVGIFNWGYVDDVLNPGREILVPLHGHVLGAYYIRAMFANRGLINTAPAGYRVSLAGINRLHHEISTAERNAIAEARLNPIEFRRGRGFVLSTSRSYSTDNRFTSIHILRSINYIVKTFRTNLDIFLQLGNTETTRRLLRNNLNNFCTALYQDGIFDNSYGYNQVVKIICDASNNRFQTTRERKMNVDCEFVFSEIVEAIRVSIATSEVLLS